MKKNVFPLSLSLLLCIAVLCGCTEGDEPIAATDGSTLTIHATADGFTAADGADTRASENGYITKFTIGDEIGVFAVDKDGAVIADCKNVKCTRNADGFWTADASVPVYYYTGAKYFAYYPYKSELSAKNITNVSGIVDYFNKNIVTDQGTYDKYTACDLMTTLHVPPIVFVGKKTLSFTLTHQMSLIEISLPVQKYKTSDAADAYEYAEPAINATFSMTKEGGATSPITPYNMGNGIYRYIVPGNTTCTIEGEFHLNSKVINYKKEISSLASGSYERVNVTYSDGSATPAVRPLAVGDFYYSDGGIIPGTTDNPPVEGCIGVIYCVDNSFITNNSTKKTDGGYTHALVVALKDASTSSTWDNAGSAVSGYQTTVAVPSNSSGWYWPNYDELKYICWGNNSSQSMNGKDALNTQFVKLNTVSSGSADTFVNDAYWSSTVHSDYTAYRVDFTDDYAVGSSKGINYRVRCSLAF
ncbi:fimbrillin family protein [Bacteroides sp. GD17]|jgi:hypothetical protein|uniref:fimbrillin family protein n=1 Tax=Bacteroides sp. GD17 TaxID=3139826 RepID=UPI0025FC67B2|nr:fimbrillin family protein [uncultured Bacteroides sp.]